jgi:hypothetical protein
MSLNHIVERVDLVAGRLERFKRIQKSTLASTIVDDLAQEMLALNEAREQEVHVTVSEYFKAQRQRIRDDMQQQRLQVCPDRLAAIGKVKVCEYERQLESCRGKCAITWDAAKDIGPLNVEMADANEKLAAIDSELTGHLTFLFNQEHDEVLFAKKDLTIPLAKEFLNTV